MKRVLISVLAFMLACCAGFAEDARYGGIIDAGNGAFFAMVAGSSKEIGTASGFGGVYEESLYVYVDAAGAETEIGFGTIYAVLEGGIVFQYSASAYQPAYQIYGFDGQKRGAAFYSGASFEGCAYSAVVAENGLYGIIDQLGTFAVEPVFTWAARPEADGIAGYESAPFICEAADGHTTLYDSATLRIIGTYDAGADYMNPAVFALESESEIRIASMQTGEILWTIQNLSADGSYRNFVSGLPDRLVIADPNSGISYLTDNRGNRIPGEYQLLLPLVWNCNKGVFLFATYEPGYIPDEEVLLSGGATLRDIHGDTFRCGLIDQDGNVLAPCEYDEIICLSIAQFELVSGDETTVLTLD